MKRRLPWGVAIVAAFGLGYWVRGDSAPEPTQPPPPEAPVPSARAPIAEEPFERTAVPERRPAIDAPPVARPGAEAADGTHPRLVATDPPAAVPSTRGGRRLTLELVNACDDTITVAWLDYDGQEQAPSIILPGTSIHSSTWEGHGFRVRLGDRKRTWVRDLVAPAAAQARIDFCGSSDAFQILDAGDDRSTPQCNVPFQPEPARTTPSVTLGPRVPMVLRNTCRGTKVRLDWVQFDGGLRPTGELEPGGVLDQHSFAGHQWRVRDALTSRWIRDFALDGGAVVDLCACE